jgi:hypothetical protein
MTLGASAMTGTTGGYLELPLNFRSDTAQFINWTGVTMTSPIASWTADVGFTDASGTVRAPGDQFDIDASNSMRIAMISEFIYGDHTVAYEKVGSGSNVYLGTGGDLSELVALSGDGLGAPGAMNYYYSKNNALPYDADTVTTLSTNTAIASELVLSMIDVSADRALYEADFYGQVMIRVWLEGWDANAYNSILSRIITASFEFTGV